ncbi:transmembrane protein 205-like [Neltuma alba]|uniref:transmembrane protein 205-like n=1 Tax=Neltuma alba TaxID=207710 RepID=UPI0010A2AD88|nr:transmembrane protein 205-like [Prosopis alba]
MGWLARLLAGLALLAAGVLFSPQTLRSGSDARISVKLSTYLRLAHLLSFSAAFGTVLWVTFIGGIIMFKNLPRHQFGNLQSKMFPAYFSTVAICCAISVASFGYQHPWKSSSSAERYQLGFLLSSLAFSLTNLFVFTPITIEMMRQRHKVERENNIGDEVGDSKNEEVAKANPRLAAMNRKFGMIHGLSSLSNIMTFGGLAFHSCYLAAKIDL